MQRKTFRSYSAALAFRERLRRQGHPVTIITTGLLGRQPHIEARYAPLKLTFGTSEA